MPSYAQHHAPGTQHQSCIDGTGDLAIRERYPTVAVFYAEIEDSKRQLH